MWRIYLAIACFCAALAQLLPGAWILAKAEVAQVLIARAWSESGLTRPWPWADTWPVMRLKVPRLGVDLYVLEGYQGNALAFGPGRMPVAGEEESPLLIAGHRDTHFRFLRDLRSGDVLLLATRSGVWQRWRVESLVVANSAVETLEATAGGLILVTCYPFDALQPGGPLRYVVRGRRD